MDEVAGVGSGDPVRRARRARPRRHPAPALVLSVLLVLVGCATPAGEGAPSDADATAPAGPAPDASPDAPAPAPPPSDRDPVPSRDCDDAERPEVERTIAAQLEAIAEGDLERAYGYASEPFRASVGLEAFETIIREGYGVLLTLERAELLECRSDGTRTAAVVGIVDASGTPGLLAYDLVLEPVGWRVRGAQLLGASGPPALTA